ncbi:MAG TPA: hypothetical protein VG893_12915 [Terracidiphilus sp.]|nr:hypothetical protein [Terracidiphilus sp.]
MHSAHTRHRKPGEEGYVLVAVIFLLAILVLSLTIALPRVKASIQRDREIETMHRGLQYRRAIQLYYRKFNRYPPNVEALVKTNEIRFLRKRYKDPMTGKDDWKPIHFGENKTPMAMGFFGQPLGLGGDVMAGTGPSGGNGIEGASPIGGGQTGGSIFGASPSPGAGAGGSPTGPTGTSGTGGTTGSSGTGSDIGSDMNQTFGGAGIVGFEPGATGQSILLYKKKNHYNEWEFLYSPLSDRQNMGSSNTGTIGAPAAPTNGSDSLFNNGTNTPGIGGGAGSGSGTGGSTTPNPQ